MKILVTGGAGFIGSHVVDEYISLGHEVVVIDDLSSGKKENLNLNAKFYQVSIMDYEKLKEIFEKEKPEVINHHAAQIDVRRSVQNPQYDANINIIGSLNLLELFINLWGKEIENKKFIFASSGGTIYGECEDNNPPDENFPHRPESPYGCAKLSIEYYLGYYTKIYKLKTVSLRYANVYGPRQDPYGEAGVVAIFTNAMLKDQPVYIYGDGEQTRDFVYVKDVAKANVKCLYFDNFEKLVLNIGTGIQTSVNSLFNLIKTLTGYQKEPIYKPSRPGELFRSYLNCNLAKKILGWQAETSLLNGLMYTVEYFKSLNK